jgi:hypothetical protein
VAHIPPIPKATPTARALLVVESEIGGDMPLVSGRGVRRGAGLLLVTVSCSVSAAAQQVIEIEETLAFDRPESWAMKYYTTLALLTGMGVSGVREAGGFELGFEGGYVPQLSDEERRVGFNGTKLEDVNKTRFFGRVSAAIGLPAHLVLELGYTPPIEAGGGTPHLFAVALTRPFDVSESWRLALRGYAQLGTMHGDITCSADEVAAGEDPELNPFLCEEPSDDTLRHTVLGLGLTSQWGEGRFRPHVGVAFSYLDLEFEVNARYSGVEDHTRQFTDGGAFALTGGLSYVPSPRWRIVAELLYSPLSVVRPPSTSSQNDAFFSGRFLVAWRIR